MSESSTTPTPVPDVQNDNRWMSLHERFVGEAKEREADVVFIGDSLIQQIKNFEVWKKFFEPLHSLNFGIGGDQTQHVLWRVENGELDGFPPRIVVLLVGTNNHSHTAEEVAEGVMKIAEAVHQKQDKAHLIAIEIPPRGKMPNTLREKLRNVNQILADKLNGMDRTTFLSVDWSNWISNRRNISFGHVRLSPFHAKRIRKTLRAPGRRDSKRFGRVRSALIIASLLPKRTTLVRLIDPDGTSIGYVSTLHRSD